MFLTIAKIGQSVSKSVVEQEKIKRFECKLAFLYFFDGGKFTT